MTQSKHKKRINQFLFYGGILVVIFLYQNTFNQPSITSVTHLQDQYPLINNQPLVLRFITQDCRICHFESDNVQRAKDWGNVNTVNVMVGNMATETYENYLTEHDLDITKSIHDKQGKLFREFDGRAVPLTAFINGQGEIHHVTLGYTSTLGMIVRYWIVSIF